VIRVDELAATMLESVVSGEGSGTIGNGELRRRGDGVLNERSKR
jgi:hypothetical protein